MSIVFGSPEAAAILARDRAVARKEVEAVLPERLTNEQWLAMPSYMATCRTCGGMLGACTDDPADTRTTAEFVAERVRKGCIVHRATVADVRKAEWCTCEKVGNS